MKIGRNTQVISEGLPSVE